MATSFRGGRSRSIRREPLTMCRQLVDFMTCAASRMHPFCNLQGRARYIFQNRIGGVMLRASSVVDRWFEPRSGQTKEKEQRLDGSATE